MPSPVLSISWSQPWRCSDAVSLATAEWVTLYNQDADTSIRTNPSEYEAALTGNSHPASRRIRPSPPLGGNIWGRSIQGWKPARQRPRQHTPARTHNLTAKSYDADHLHRALDGLHRQRREPPEGKRPAQQADQCVGAMDRGSKLAVFHLGCLAGIADRCSLRGRARHLHKHAILFLHNGFQ